MYVCVHACSLQSWFEASNRGAIHASLLALYGWGGWLVSQGLMPMRVMVSGIGFTFSLMYATQGAVSSLSELRRAAGAFSRVSHSTREDSLFSSSWKDMSLEEDATIVVGTFGRGPVVMLGEMFMILSWNSVGWSSTS